MNIKKNLLLGLMLVFFIGCSANKTVSPRIKIQNQSFLNGKVMMQAQNQVIIAADAIQITSEEGTEFNKLASKIAKQTLLIRGLETKVNGQKARIEDIRGNNITFKFEKKPTFEAETPVNIYIPRKTLAITGFEVIRKKKSKNAEKLTAKGKVFVENLTSALVNTNQFNIVERSKLETILKELELGDSGLVDASTSAKLGKLLQADLILTGSIAPMRGKIIINLRLVNVETGLIIAALNEKVKRKGPAPQEEETPRYIQEDPNWEPQQRPSHFEEEPNSNSYYEQGPQNIRGGENSYRRPPPRRENRRPPRRW